MDWLTWKQEAVLWLRKHGYLVLALVMGIFLMTLPEKKPPQILPEETTSGPDLSQQLEDILSRMEGAGRVKVLLTQASGEKTLYQTDVSGEKTQSSQDRRSTTVLVRDGSREERGLVVQVIPPTYQGAVVLCQGGDNPRVQLAMVEAVMSLTGLRSDAITVLKMK